MDRSSELVQKKRRISNKKEQLLIDLNIAYVSPTKGKMVDLTDQPEEDGRQLPNLPPAEGKMVDVIDQPEKDVRELPNLPPAKGKMVDSTAQPKKDVLAPPNFCIYLCFPNEDMERLRDQYQVMGKSSSEKEDQFQRLGFVHGIKTLMFTRRKKPRCHDKHARVALGRSLFKKRCTDKNQKNPDDDDDDEADRLDSKQKLKEFVEQAKARARNAKPHAKKVESTVTVRKKNNRKKEKMLPLVQVLEASKGHAVFFK